VTGCKAFQPCSLVQSNFRVLPLLARGKAYAALLRHPVIKSLIRSVIARPSCGTQHAAYHVRHATCTIKHVPCPVHNSRRAPCNVSITTCNAQRWHRAADPIGHRTRQSRQAHRSDVMRKHIPPAFAAQECVAGDAHALVHDRGVLIVCRRRGLGRRQLSPGRESWQPNQRQRQAVHAATSVLCVCARKRTGTRSLAFLLIAFRR
jgi:hypothetical protein